MEPPLELFLPESLLLEPLSDELLPEELPSLEPEPLLLEPLPPDPLP